MADPEVSSTLWFFTIASCGFAVTYVGASDESPCTPVMGMISPFGAQHLNRKFIFRDFKLQELVKRNLLRTETTGY